MLIVPFLQQYHRDHPPNPRCDHDKDKAATLGGTWTKVSEDGREKIVCRVCQAFYGFLRQETRTK